MNKSIKKPNPTIRLTDESLFGNDAADLEHENLFYSYERDVLYAFSIPMYYGLGSRYYLNMHYDFNKSLSFWFKIAQTVYADDRDSVSSGNESISGNRKTDIRFLMKWKF